MAKPMIFGMDPPNLRKNRVPHKIFEKFMCLHTSKISTMMIYFKRFRDPKTQKEIKATSLFCGFQHKFCGFIGSNLLNDTHYF